jgi:WD40 repeat protein
VKVQRFSEPDRKLTGAARTIRHGPTILEIVQAEENQVLLRDAHGVHRLDLHSGRELWSLPHGNEDTGGGQGLCLSVDGKWLACPMVCDAKVRFRIVETATGVLRAECPVPQSPQGLTRAAVSTDGRTLAFVHDCTIVFFDVPTGKELARCPGHSDQITALLFTPDGRTLVSGSLDRSVRLWNVPGR